MTTSVLAVRVVAALAAAALWSPAHAQTTSFVNFESGHVRPLALSPDGSLLFAVNTPDNRLAIYTVGSGTLTLAGEVEVGLEPVAVATRTNSAGEVEAWVVNHLSDSVSIVAVGADPAFARVVRTLLVGDEPRDVVFAGSGGTRAFVTTARRGQNLPAGLTPRLSDPGVGRGLVWAFDADAPGGALGGTPLAVVELFCDTPRGLAVSPDGSRVYAAAFHSGNRTTTIAEPVVTGFLGLPPPPVGAPSGAPRVGLIVRFDPVSGQWRDELDRDWSSRVAFSLPDRDVFVVDADANPPALVAPPNAVASVGTVLFNLAVNPASGRVIVSNLESRNEVRFENFLQGEKGVRGHVAESRLTVIDGTTPTSVHINDHIDYSVPTGDLDEVGRSLAFPTDLAFSSDGALLYVAALGSAKIGVFDAAALEAGDGTPLARIPVGNGPTGIVVDEARDQLYVMNRVDHTVAVVSGAGSPLGASVAATVPLRFDPSPFAARDGRGVLYDAASASGHGDASCASCHVFGDLDSLAWDLGDPNGTVQANPNPFVGGGTPSVPFHPLKGPMTTQSLRGMADMGPMHWRGDRTGGATGGDPLDEVRAFTAFNAAFPGLLGRPSELTAAEMQRFTDFALSLRYPPNPVKALDDVATPEQAAGLVQFVGPPSDGGPCVACHALPFGGNGLSTREGAETQDFKVPHVRNAYAKVGMFGIATGFFGIPPTPFMGDQIRGFGYLHDGSISSLFDFLKPFAFPSDVERRQVEAFVFALDTGLKPVVGQQLTIGPGSFAGPPPALVPAVAARLGLLMARADAGDCDLVVKVVAQILGERRGGVYVGGGQFQLDRLTDAPVSATFIVNVAAAPGLEATFTCVPPGLGVRMGIDRDEDGQLDQDEISAGGDPAAPWDLPAGCPGGAVQGLAKPQLKVAANLEPAGDERLTVKGEWVLPTPVSPALDPLRYGFNLRVLAANGTELWHRSVPPVPSPGGSAAGWRTNKTGTRWTFRDVAGTLAGGITKIVVSDHSKSFPGLVKVRVSGKNGDFRIPTDQLPVTLILVPGGAVQVGADQCGTRTFNGAGGVTPKCEVQSGGAGVKCG